jgi:hypothetical protein
MATIKHYPLNTRIEINGKVLNLTHKEYLELVEAIENDDSLTIDDTPKPGFMIVKG